MARMAGFLNVATVPLRWILPQRVQESEFRHTTPNVESTVDTQSPETVLNRATDGNPRTSDRVRVLMEQGETFALEGYTVEELTDLCLRFAYQWRFHPPRGRALRVVLAPTLVRQDDESAS